MVASYSEFRDKVVLVTGIGQAKSQDKELWGNGAATARQLARQGAIVIGVDVKMEDAEWTRSRIITENPSARVHLIAADLTKPEDVANMVKVALNQHGTIHYLVNNVGMSCPGGPVEQDPKTFAKQLEVNLTSTFLCCKEVIPVMEKQGGGAITVTSSIAGLGYMGKMHIGYSTTKAALLNFAKCVAVGYASKGIRINAVVPGLIMTPLVERLALEYHEGDYTGLISQRSNGVPLKRQGTSADVAEATLFLLSDSASYITGTSLIVDGGSTAVVCSYG